MGGTLDNLDCFYTCNIFHTKYRFVHLLMKCMIAAFLIYKTKFKKIRNTDLH